MFLAERVYSQDIETITVTGTVIDEEQTPLIGATIVIKGTTKGTITDVNGKFSVSCQPNDVLTFSFIGFNPEDIIATGSKDIEVTLIKDLMSLNEIVVVGYGTMKKQDLTGSIASVSAEELNKGVITTTEQALQGKIAGLTIIKGSGDPTSGATMRLRGSTSLSASSSPLVVVDGIPGVDINTVQPSDIESVDVLKDASAAAIYGSRGANGVILITTTKAKKGMNVEYSNYVAWSKPSNTLDLLTADEWREKVVELEETSAIDFGASTDWQDEITQNTLSQSHTLAFSNNREDGGYRASLTYMNNEGIIINSYLQRLGASLSAYSYGLNGKLKLDFGTHTTFDKYTPGNNAAFERAYNVNPTAPVYGEDGEFFQTFSNLANNPVEILTNVSNDQTTKRFLGYAKAELEIFKGLKGVVNTSYEYSSHQGRYYLPSYSFFGSAERGVANRSLNDYTNMQLETYLNYTKEILRDHTLNVMAGYSYLDNTYEGFFAQNRNFDTDIFEYNNLGAGLELQANDISSYKGNAKLISFFGRLNYSYRGRYMLTATLRRDGSSRFGANNRWGLFPSVAAAWRVSDESFMSSSRDWLTHLKLRVGYGVTGSQDAIGEYKTLALLGIVGGKYYDPASDSWKISYSPIQNPNPDLKWETTTQTNIGIDFSLFNNLSATIDLYNKFTSDLLFVYSVPVNENLYHETLANVGDLSNKGIEFSLDWKVIDHQDLTWNMNLSMARNQLLVERLSNDIYQTEAVPYGSLHGLRGMSNQYSQTIREGYSVGTFWGPVCFGLDEDGDFILDTADSDLGSALPKFTLGFNTAVVYKNFDLSIAAYGLFGQKVLNATAMTMNDPSRFPDLNAPHRMFNDSIQDDPTFCSYWVEDASFFRLQSVTLGYSFSLDKIGISKLRVYVSGENLFVLTNYTGLDPEVSIESYNSSNGRMDPLSNPGIDRYDVYPKSRSFIAGVNISF
ncbi:MAG: TonB-dependent receptor [Bacteroidales bacterium]|nr:TonB-dependent receptor [Bacteroidales bacterium]